MANQVEEIKFNAIPDDKFADGSKELQKIQSMGAHLATLSVLWNNVANAADAAKLTAEYKLLQDSKIKIVDLNGIDPETKVFLGGSRKKRQSKKRKNHKNHNNNQ